MPDFLDLADSRCATLLPSHRSRLRVTVVLPALKLKVASIVSRLRGVSAKDANRKVRKRKGGEGGVMGSLPSTRPARIGGRREPPASAGDPVVTQRVASPKPKPKPKPAAAPKRSTPQAPRPQPVKAAAPELDDVAPPSSARTHERAGGIPQSGTQLVGTVVQAAGELAQIGLTVGGQVIKRAVGRIPRP